MREARRGQRLRRRIRFDPCCEKVNAVCCHRRRDLRSISRRSNLAASCEYRRDGREEEKRKGCASHYLERITRLRGRGLTTGTGSEGSDIPPALSARTPSLVYRRV